MKCHSRFNWNCLWQTSEEIFLRVSFATGVALKISSSCRKSRFEATWHRRGELARSAPLSFILSFAWSTQATLKSGHSLQCSTAASLKLPLLRHAGALSRETTLVLRRHRKKRSEVKYHWGTLKRLGKLLWQMESLREVTLHSWSFVNRLRRRRQYEVCPEKCTDPEEENKAWPQHCESSPLAWNYSNGSSLWFRYILQVECLLYIGTHLVVYFSLKKRRISTASMLSGVLIHLLRNSFLHDYNVQSL